ncbi:MAG: iron-sulfur cluster assembly scaffold protein [Rhodobacteraceae bacterium]|nr:MAG: iron-sulfur cluster assembly scaffold protein [Paracoccaceae bacterium]
MSDAQDLIQLYSKRILALAADIPHSGRLDAPDGTAMKRSPLCGSTVTVDVRMDQGRVADFAQDVKACALGQASAAVLGAVAVGRTRDEIVAGRDALKAMLKENAPPPPAPFDGLAVLEPAKDYKNRHASILLAYDAAIDAIDAADAKASAG